MRFYKIENGKVTNIIEAEQAFIDTLVDTYVANETAFIGQDYDGTNFITPTVVLPTLEENKATKIKQVQSKYEAQRLSLMPLPEERKTWDIQEAEYNAYMLDNLAPTPGIDGLVAGDTAVGGTITKAELITKIGLNITAYVNAIAMITGMQHGYERKINACTTQAELDLIVV